MKIAILPHWFKWIGLAIAIFAGLTSFERGFQEGTLSGQSDSSNQTIQNREKTTLPEYNSYTKSTLWGITMRNSIWTTLGVLGLTIIMFSKDRHYDEYLLKLKLDSVLIVFLLSVISLTVRSFIIYDIDIDAPQMLEHQLTAYLIIYHSKKRIVLWN